VADHHGDPTELMIKLEHDKKKTASLRDQLKVILAEAMLCMNSEHLLQNFDLTRGRPRCYPSSAPFHS
jgi:hypothetical protein